MFDQQIVTGSSCSISSSIVVLVHVDAKKLIHSYLYIVILALARRYSRKDCSCLGEVVLLLVLMRPEVL